jgi:hypothetical protein
MVPKFYCQDYVSSAHVLSTFDEDQRDLKGFRPNLSRRSEATEINSTAYDLDDANSREQQANPSRREELLGRF